MYHPSLSLGSSLSSSLYRIVYFIYGRMYQSFPFLFSKLKEHFPLYSLNTFMVPFEYTFVHGEKHRFNLIF